MLTINLGNDSHDIIHFVVIEEDLDQFGLVHRLQVTLVGTIELPSIPGLVYWVITPVILMTVNFLVKSFHCKGIFLIVELAKVYPLSAVFRPSREGLNELLLVICRQVDSEPL